MMHKRNTLFSWWKKYISLIVLTVGLLLFLGLYISNIKTHQQTIVINEVCCNNYLAYENAIGKYDGYIELYNCSNQEVQLDEYYLVNSADKEKYSYLEGLSIGAYDYIVLSADGQTYDQNICNVPFEFDYDVATVLCLKNKNGDVVDKVELPKMDYDMVYCRSTDGNEKWEIKSPSPNASNEAGKQIVLPTLPMPDFSLESGFYGGACTLELTNGSKNALGFLKNDIEIYYTTDGSVPNKENGTRYISPIDLKKISERENEFCLRTDVSAGFQHDEIRKRGWADSGYCVPTENVDKAVIIRAVTIDANGNSSEVATKHYFIDYMKDSAYENVSIVSLVTEPENLFSEEYGIYVEGKHKYYFEDRAWDWWPANYWQAGRAWERPCEIAYFNPDKEFEFSQTLGVRIKGNSSRGYSQKSLKLYAREVLSGEKAINSRLFNNQQEIRTFALFNGGQDLDARVKDYLVHSMTRERAFDTMDFIPCALFLNGEYWGMFYATQEYNAEYIAGKYGVDKENVVIIKEDTIKEGVDADLQDYLDFVKYVNETDFSDPNNYATLCQKMDIQSYIDYYCVQTYIARCEDWPRANLALWKTREVGNGLYDDGKWRWMLFDVNAFDGAMEEELIEFDGLDLVIYHDSLFLSLIRIPQVKEQFCVTMMDLINTTFNYEEINVWLECYQNELKEPVVKTLHRFYGENKGEIEFDRRIESIDTFFKMRKNSMIEDMQTNLPLYGTVEEVMLETNDVDAGEIYINTIIPEMAGGIWRGEYFTDYPIRVTAIPKEGYYFAGWEGSVVSDEASISVPVVEGGIYLKAVFIAQ